MAGLWLAAWAQGGADPGSSLEALLGVPGSGEGGPLPAPKGGEGDRLTDRPDLKDRSLLLVDGVRGGHKGPPRPPLDVV